MKKTRIIGAGICILLALPLFGQNENVISLVREATVRSDILSEKRNIRIYFPRDYEPGELRYPVLYLLDGDAHFQHATAAVNFLRNYLRVPDMIIVAILNVDRNRDFSPVYEPSVPTSGGAAKFLGFLSDELIPDMDRDFRTSGYNILFGHSFGGTFAGYALVEKPDLFDAYIAVSPYLQFSDNYVVERTKAEMKPVRDRNVSFYMTVGDEPDYFNALDAFASAVRERCAGTVDLEYKHLVGDDHSTAPYISLFNGLRHIFRDYPLPPEMMGEGLKAIDQHYRKLSEKFGIDASTPEFVINQLGYRYLQQEQVDRAISVFRENVKRYPGSANVYDSLGEAYENNLEYERAEENYRKAYELGLQLKDPNTAVYKNNLDRLSGD